MTRANPLPDDVETLKAMPLSQQAALRERDAQVLKLQETVDSQQAALASRAAEVEHLKLLIAVLRRVQFGRKSEKLDHQIQQLELRLEELEADAVNHIDEVTQRNAGLVEVSAAATERLKTQARELVQAGAVFELAVE